MGPVHVAWLGKKSPFCGNVTYGLAITEALRERGHGVSFFHFDTPAAQLSLGRMFRTSLQQEDAAALDTGHGTESDWNDGQGSPVTTTALADGLPEVALPYLLRSQIYTIPSPQAARDLRHALQRLQPDLVHASLTLSPLDFRLPEICQQLGLPLVATFHSPFNARQRSATAATMRQFYKLYAPALARYSSVVVFSELQAQELTRLGVPQSRLAVIPNGIDSQAWCPGPGAMPTVFQGKRLFLYMGRLAPEKNVEALLKAWRIIRPEGCLLAVVGDGPLRASLPLASDDGTIYWWGYEQRPEQRLNLLRNAEVFVLPSLVEGLSLALLEAMAVGTACVATDAGAHGEVLAGGAGIVLSTDNVAAQLRTILPILRDQPRLTADLGHQARQRVLEHYTLADNVNALECLYRQHVSI
ncbi:MAG: glycosyltransferase family 4 protein [Synechococcus sp. SB0668_bin_15]|nr:glycosyltransferase family 4 protein [Synechococcus sp. SB0668_bin_15]MXZ82483.1 glycosyltransferase family 4 protein [Synechococcus sp. SB0666_bin_14]MYC49782.1 glycosyltransferase family 4 protein [Synechococcus sp. SB0662_bin_14]MYG46288.1 glycosyltransferase family 4 protein [Synechococcus sp. SB0675_bin_6]MYJ59915.1 glycosyltransferase family 4 protein [Synechococcus sp. SB0672_bin_6]MYK91397.1 glycosyltransferase family 4 protein [Synechococcus sp. SB0669_bin_8]